MKLWAIVHAWQAGVLTDGEAMGKVEACLQLTIAAPRTRQPKRSFARLTPRLVRSILDLCAEGCSNLEVEQRLRTSAGTVQRIRVRSIHASNHHPTIDAWWSEHPDADVRMGDRTEDVRCRNGIAEGDDERAASSHRTTGPGTPGRQRQE